MKTIKIIDLLNKIANEEEVPEKVKYDVLEETKDYIYTYSKKDNDYTCLDEFNEKEYLFNQIFSSTITNLNDVVEIIEEEKEIETIDMSSPISVVHCAMKINELIDVVNELKRDK